MTDADVVPEDAGDGMTFDAPQDADVSVVTSGDPLRSTMEIPRVLADELKMRFRPDGIHMQAVDPANVGMFDIDWHQDGFTGYQYNHDPSDQDEIVAGVSLIHFRRVANFARKRDDDPVRIDLLGMTDGNPRMRVSVLRPDQQVKRTSVFGLIDPDSIRQEPDIPELDLRYRATPGVRPLRDVVQEIKANHDHSWFAIDGNDLVLGSQPNANPRLADDADTGDGQAADAFTFPNAAWVADDSDVGDDRGSIFSNDYLKDMTMALKQAKVDRVTVKFGEEYPAVLDFDTPDWNVSGRMMLAPRIMSE
jgi:proliferating cell nuclear antigen